MKKRNRLIDIAEPPKVRTNVKAGIQRPPVIYIYCSIFYIMPA